MSDKYSEIERKIYLKHKLSDVGSGNKPVNEIIKKVSEMIADAIKLADEINKNNPPQGN